MNRTTNLCAGLLVAMTTVAAAQNPKTGPQVPEDLAASRQLIAWSWMQEPQPIPQPEPPRDKRIPQPGRQAKPPANPQSQQQIPTLSVTGGDTGGDVAVELLPADGKPQR